MLVLLVVEGVLLCWNGVWQLFERVGSCYCCCFHRFDIVDDVDCFDVHVWIVWILILVWMMMLMY
jgi:hypothetical protein